MKNHITQINQHIQESGNILLVIYRLKRAKEYTNFKPTLDGYMYRSARILQFAIAYAARLPGAVEER